MSHIRSSASILAGLVLGAVLVIVSFGGRPGAGGGLAVPQALRPGVAEGASDCDGTRSVQVSGAATINVVPDRVMIKLGVQTNGATPDGVLAENMAAIDRVVATVRVLGVAAEDISTDYYLVYPIYDDWDNLTIEGYRVDNVVAVTLRDANLTGPLLVQALKSGANQVVDVQFYTSELRRYRDEARELALKAAQEKAQALAQAAGAETGCLLGIDETSSSYYTGYGWGSRNQANWTQNVVQNVGSLQPGAADDGPVSLGRIAVRADVSASFSLR